jgi:hypothetical protein
MSNVRVRPVIGILLAITAATASLSTVNASAATKAAVPSTSPVLKAPVEAAVLPGWRLPILGPVGNQWVEGRSGDGRTQVLIEKDAGERGSVRPVTKFAVVKLTKAGKPLPNPKIIELKGQFGYDAVNNAGTVLFLTENRDVEAPGTYRVRMLDLLSGDLSPQVVSEERLNSEAFVEAGARTEAESLMYGTAIARVRNPLKTRWIFTLYDAPGKRPFVHALNTEGWALCVDLPKHGKDINELAKSWTLAADQSMVTVTNTTLAKAWKFAIGTETLLPA